MKNFRQLVSLCWDGRLIQFFDDQMQSWYYQVLLNSSILSAAASSCANASALLLGDLSNKDGGHDMSSWVSIRF